MADRIFTAGTAPAHRPEVGAHSGGVVPPPSSIEGAQPVGDAHRDVDDLTGMAWWNSLTDEQRAAALAAADTATPAKAWARAKAAGGAPVAAVPADDHSLASVVADIAREIRAWGSVGLYGAADKLDNIAQVLAAEVPTAPCPASRRTGPAIEPSSSAYYAERMELVVRAACQIRSMMKVLMREAYDVDGDFIFSTAIRAHDLARMVSWGLEADDDVEQLGAWHREVYGTDRTAEGAAS